MSFLLSVAYINLPVNPADLNNPSIAATAAPRDGGRDKDVREEEETGQKEGLYLLCYFQDTIKTMDWLKERRGLKPLRS